MKHHIAASGIVGLLAAASCGKDDPTDTTDTTDTTTGPVECVDIAAAAFDRTSANGYFAQYVAPVTTPLGDAPDDALILEFFGAALGDYDGEATGTFELGAGADGNYASCSRCLLVAQDPGAEAVSYFATSGTLVVDPSSEQLIGTALAQLSDVTLVEVTIDDVSFTSAPVPGGGCLHLDAAEVAYTPPPGPPGWACDVGFYGDGACDCGCGVIDVDCPDATVASCEFCDALGSCNTGPCPGTINPVDNATCVM